MSRAPHNSTTHRVRLATQADVATLVDLMREFYAESGYPLTQPWAERAFLRLIEDSSLGCVWLAETEGQAVGHIVLTTRYAMEHGALSGYVDDLFVKPMFRRRGIARALLTALVHECELRECRAISVEVGALNAAALGLYAEFGLTPVSADRLLLSGARQNNKS